jgi:hypothetical protein
MPVGEVGRKTAKSPASWSAEEPLFKAQIMPELALQCQCECGHWRGFPLRNQPNSPVIFGANATACSAWPPNSGNLVAWRELALLTWMVAAVSSYPVFEPNSNFQLLTRLTVLFGKDWRRPSFAVSLCLSCGFTLRRQRE